MGLKWNKDISKLSSLTKTKPKTQNLSQIRDDK